MIYHPMMMKVKTNMMTSMTMKVIFKGSKLPTLFTVWPSLLIPIPKSADSFIVIHKITDIIYRMTIGSYTHPQMC